MRLKILVPAVLCGSVLTCHAASSALLGWNNLGMHCMDSDFSVFSILPPYNTIEAQLIVGGKLVTNGAGYSITYQAVADPAGSVNSTSVGKGNFYDFTGKLYGQLTPDSGLAGWGMPGLNNTPQAMLFERTNQPAAGVETRVNWFRAEGIPITPYDDSLQKNPYPLMRLIAWNASKQPVATNDIVLPVSDEMDCRLCHGSGTQAAARPSAGWVRDANSDREYRLNILLLHDDREFAAHPAEYSAALSARGYNASGLYMSVVKDNKPVLCAACHASEALGTSSYGDIPPLTSSIHAYHAHVQDPVLNMTLDDSDNRAACYRCHPGSATKCLRGAMGSAVAKDGSMEMQCQSCHGGMSQVGSPDRVGWFMEPTCQSCHTGTATRNNGQIRYTSVFSDANGTVRVPVDNTFATTPNTPAPGLSLYRFSVGHGGLQCSACHGSTHAEFPSSHANDNIASTRLQGHAGVVAECTACHATMPTSPTGGPHGMHPIGQSWVDSHGDAVSSVGLAKCQACHGSNNRGTVLSQVQGTRTFTGEHMGTQKFYRGGLIGCYTCHNGPSSESLNTSTPPSVSSVSTNTTVGQPVSMTLPVTGANAALRILTQPAHGTVGLVSGVATYFPDPGFVGADKFTFAAYDGAKNSGLATGAVTVGAETPATVTVAATDSRAGEPGSGLGTGTFTFSRTGPTTAALAVNFTLNGTATSGVDYAVPGTTVTIAAGLSTATKTVTVVNDSVPEGDETVILTLQAGPGYALGNPSSATILIKDDEGAGEIVVDDAAAGFVGTWSRSTNVAGYYGTGYHHDQKAGKGSKSATFKPNLPAAGNYEVYIWYPASKDRATNVLVDVVHEGVATTSVVNQQKNGARWNYLGTYHFAAGDGGYAIIRTDGTVGYVIADAVKFVPVVELVVDDPAATYVGTWSTSTSIPGYFGAGYHQDQNAGKGSKSATFTPNLPVSGDYDVYLWYASAASRATNVPLIVVHEGVTNAVTINQTIGGGKWNKLGTYHFGAGTGGYVKLRNAGTTGYVIADAVRWVSAPSLVALQGLNPPMATTQPAGSLSLELAAGQWPAPAALLRDSQGRLVLQWPTEPGVAYTVCGTSDLSAPWDVTQETLGDGTVQTMPVADFWKFYRVFAEPAGEP